MPPSSESSASRPPWLASREAASSGGDVVGDEHGFRWHRDVLGGQGGGLGFGERGVGMLSAVGGFGGVGGLRGLRAGGFGFDVGAGAGRGAALLQGALGGQQRRDHRVEYC
jgi:hypothetical protein